MADHTTKTESESSSALDRLPFSGLEKGHLCPRCGSQTATFASVLKANEENRLSISFSKALPKSEAISRWLRPPDLPAEERIQRRDIWDTSFFLAVSFVVILLAGLMLTAILGLQIAVPITFVSLVFVFMRTKATKPRIVAVDVKEQNRALTLKAWDHRMETWERLGVCPTCHAISDRETKRFEEWHSVPNLFL